MPLIHKTLWLVKEAVVYDFEIMIWNQVSDSGKSNVPQICVLSNKGTALILDASIYIHYRFSANSLLGGRKKQVNTSITRQQSPISVICSH